jgi:hypothetical protein
MGYKVTKGKKTPDLSIVCSVVKKLPVQLSKGYGSSDDGWNQQSVIETGYIYALQSHTARYCPAPGGVSVGHRDITAGTWLLGKEEWAVLHPFEQPRSGK